MITLVTGATGFTGFALTKHLRQRGEEVRDSIIDLTPLRQFILSYCIFNQ